ncbi:pilus assembly protein CpaB [Volucribacter psittacicida]|uniref:Pilus assembly protein CpaB n=1 Tax=Volucribacter psittacicida TaxID=203482 RepID=A0A4R1G2C0_9PAST|nr:flp operon protein C [Volucribacter psittacicida]TCJ97821.1 pilus assembly protein CpaB [Volucribacter psittacicida]
MNYRLLFIISIFMLIIGFFGLFMMPSSSNNQQTDLSSEVAKTENQKEKKRITIATLVKNVKAGELLQVEDYQLSDQEVDIDDHLVDYDVSDLITNQANGLQGYLVSQNIQASSLLLPSSLIAPTDPRFLSHSIDAKKEVGYRIPVSLDNAYILDSLHSGHYVSIYAQKYASGNETLNRKEAVLLQSSVQVLNVVKEADNNEKQAGYIVLKLNGLDVVKLYSLPEDSMLFVLPNSNKLSDKNRGIFIRKLRGQ